MVWFEGLRADGVDSRRNFRSISEDSEGLRAGSTENRRRSMSQLKQAEQIQPSSTFLFHLGFQWIECRPPTLGRATCLPQSANSNAAVFQTPSKTHLEIMLGHISGHPEAQSRGHIKLSHSGIRAGSLTCEQSGDQEANSSLQHHVMSVGPEGSSYMKAEHYISPRGRA